MSDPLNTDSDMDQALEPFLDGPCPFCGTPLYRDRPHKAVPCPIFNNPYPIKQLAMAILRLSQRVSDLGG